MANQEDENKTTPSEQPPGESSPQQLTEQELAKIAGGASRCGKCGSPLEFCTCNV